MWQNHMVCHECSNVKIRILNYIRYYISHIRNVHIMRNNCVKKAMSIISIKCFHYYDHVLFLYNHGLTSSFHVITHKALLFMCKKIHIFMYISFIGVSTKNKIKWYILLNIWKLVIFPSSKKSWAWNMYKDLVFCLMKLNHCHIHGP